jgi:gliding motility-associated-like protein
MWVYFWDSIPNGNYPVGQFIDNAPVVVDFNTGNIADQVAIGDFDNNFKPDIFYKSWRIGSGRINVIPNFSYRVKGAVTPSAICNGQTAVLTATSNTIGINPTYSWFPGSSTTPLGSGGTFSVTQPATYYTRLTFPFPYTNSATCSFFRSDTVQILAKSDPTITVVGANAVCYGTTTTFTATGSGSGSYSYTWTAPNSAVISNSNVAVTNTVFATDIYTVTGRDILTNCTGSTTATIGLLPPNTDFISASKQTLCPGDSSRLSVQHALSYTWSTGNTSDSAITVKPSVTSNYAVIYKDVNGCLSTKTISIDMDPACSVKIYNTVTTNGDNLNDVWTIDNISKYPNNKVTIFNRWGKKVFETQGYDNVSNFWPQRNVDKLDPTTYYYVLDLGDGSKLMKGWIELIHN